MAAPAVMPAFANRLIKSDLQTVSEMPARRAVNPLAPIQNPVYTRAHRERRLFCHIQGGLSAGRGDIAM